MKQIWNKKMQTYVMIGCMAAIITACGNKTEPMATGSPSPTQTVAPSEASSAAPSTEPSALPSVTPVPTPGANKIVQVYGIDEETQEPKSVEAVVPADEEITPQVVVDLVVKSFADQSIAIGIDEVTKEKDIVIVSFKKDQAPLANVGSGTEATILDAIANSLRENLADCKNVIFRVEGKAYESGHIMFDLNETYY